MPQRRLRQRLLGLFDAAAGAVTVVMLALLRITIGWHFLYQGIAKLDDQSFSSAGFLSQSKGPLADYFRSLVPDALGRHHRVEHVVDQRV